MTDWPRRRPILYFVTDRARLSTRSVESLLERVEIAVRAGIHVVQIRERDLSDRALASLVRGAVAIARPSGVAVLVNDRVDVALAAGADGVHLRTDSIAPARMRRDAPQRFVIGRSIHSLAEARAIDEHGGCDYLLFGTVFASPGKPAGHRASGPALLGEVCASTRLPVLGIGGIDAVNAGEIAAAGAAGLAAIGAFTNGDASAVAARVRAMREAFDRGSSLV